ncbi:unnamed protein product [Phytophthora lilii]|uniref:Unnamed protein product n=1 Tax=Phytophthora lilii TaxID=2077276 RepID=A0A9W7CYD6_9STRA|nr:unnamed protein product [Phytophthora lilii]
MGRLNTRSIGLNLRAEDLPEVFGGDGSSGVVSDHGNTNLTGDQGHNVDADSGDEEEKQEGESDEKQEEKSDGNADSTDETKETMTAMKTNAAR